MAELLIGLGLSSLVAIVGYRVLVHSTRVSHSAIQRSRSLSEIQKFASRLDQEIENAVAIPKGSGTTALGNRSSNDCGSALVTSGLVAFPSYSRKRIDGLGSDPKAPGATVDPSEMGGNILPESSDALRIAFYSRESQSHRVKQDTTGSHPTIVIDSGGPDVFHVGDYAVISNGDSSDLLRVTDFTVNGADATITHDATSAWNVLPFTRQYVLNSDSAVTIQKVNLVTYTLHSDNIIYLHDHEADDGFNSGGLDGSGVQRGVWVPIAAHVQRFHVFFETTEKWPPFISGDPPGYRTPRATLPEQGKDEGTGLNCINQIGYPLLLRVRYQIKTDIKEEGDRPLEHAVAPTNILLSYRHYGNLETGVLDPFITGPVM